MSLARDVRLGFAKRPRTLPPKYFYDTLGSRLFDTLGELPWYRITRAEKRLLPRAAKATGAALRAPVHVVELGSGNGEKLCLVVEALDARGLRSSVHVVDVSAEALAKTREKLWSRRRVPFVGHRATYEAGLGLAAQARSPRGSMLVLFLGSNIGNFDPPHAARLLSGIRRRLRPGDALLLGTDLVKPEAELLLAYDDPLGLTAAFNRNVLLRLNRELDADFDLEAWEHRAVWNREESRVEMRLVSRRAQRVSIPGAGVSVSFRRGETIWTESSYKYETSGVSRMARDAGFRCERQWVDREGAFAISLCVAVPAEEGRPT